MRMIIISAKRIILAAARNPHREMRFSRNTRYILMLVLSSFCIPAKASGDTLRLQLKWWHQFQFAGYYAAQLKGFYSAEGLNVKLLEGDIQHNPVEEVLSGRAQFGISGSDLIVNYAQGKPLMALAALFQHSPYTMVSLAAKNIRSPSDLVGKTIMVSEKQGWVELQAVFLKEDIPINSLKIVSHSWNNDDLVNGKVDAITGYVTVELNQLRKKGVTPSYIQPLNYGIDFYGDVLFSLNTIPANNPEKTRRFLKASIKGWDYAMEHIEEMTDYILTLPGVKERGVTKSDLLAEAEEMRKLILSDMVEVGHMNEGRWSHILDTYKSLKLVPQDVKLDGFIYNESQTLSSKFIRVATTISVISVLVFLVIILYSISLRSSVKKRTVQLENEIAQRMLTQEQLRISEERLEMATNAAGIGIWDWDLQTNQIYYNDMWKIMLGYDPKELENVYETFSQLLHPDEKDSVLQRIMEHVGGKRKDEYKVMIRMKTRDKKWKWILSVSKSALRDKDGNIIRFSGIHIDMDDIKQKELELKSLTEELMNSNGELQQFAYITSHNLRAPVANLRSLTWLFDQESLTKKNKILFEKTALSISRLSDTLDDLNEILSTRVHKAADREIVSFEKELADIIYSISEEIKEKQAVITFDFSKAPAVCYPRKVIDSIFINMLTNAIKYRKKEEAPSIHLTTEEDGDFVILTVKDNGQGIDMDKYGNKVFGLYQRFHESTDGKGLGLYIVKNQVEALGGKIAVESILNKGTVFYVFLKKITMPYEA